MDQIKPETELLRHAANGSETAFTSLFRMYQHKLYSYLLHATGSPEMTEDIIQDVFLKLWRDKDKLADIDNFGGYVYRMCQHRVINAFKRMAKETLILAGMDNTAASVAAAAEDNLAAREVNEQLKAALDKLPPKQKLVFMLSREQGLKHDEIARHLNISPSTVNNHMIEALRTIRKQLNAHLHTTSGACCLLGIITSFQQ